MSSESSFPLAPSERRMDPKLRKSRDSEFLNWLADRLVHIYHESPNVDFVMKLREIATKLDRK